jgi:hypothetical protein
VKQILSMAEPSVTHDYSVIPAVTVDIPSSSDMTLIRQLPGIESIQEDGIMSINYE